MMVSDLPDELHSIILCFLPRASLKRARLVSRRWNDVGSRWLFPRVYFRPHYEIMDIFKKITDDARFTIGVTKIVYDARMFCSEMLDRESHDEAWPYAFESTDSESETDPQSETHLESETDPEDETVSEGETHESDDHDKISKSHDTYCHLVRI